MNDLLFKLFELSSKGYGCSQILILLGLDHMEKENPDLVRAMAGLCMGNGGGVCGVLSGAACLLALYSGKGGDLETENQVMPVMLEELNDWFADYTAERYGSLQCATIMGEATNTPDMERCGEILTDTYEKVMKILISNGFDPAGES